MFENIAALSNIAKELQLLDAEAKTIVDDYTTLMPKVRDDLMALAFQRDNLASISSAIRELRSDAESVTSESPKEVISKSPISEESGTTTIEPDFELSPEEDAALAETEKVLSESLEEDDEAGIVVEHAPGSIFPPEQNDELDIESNPTPEFENEV